MNKTKRILIVVFGILFALSSCNSKHELQKHCKDGCCDHACELDHLEENYHKHHYDEFDHDDEHDFEENEDFNLGNDKLGISILSKSNVGINHDGLRFGTYHVIDSDLDYGTIQLQANYQPEGCLTDSIWSVGDSNILSATPSAVDSSICTIKALQEFEGFVTISVRSKFFSDINATLKATYSGGFKIEVISGNISLNATRKCAHEGTSISESTGAKSNLNNYFKVKYKGNYLSNSQLYNYINSGELIVTTSGDLSFVNNSSAPYFVMKDLTSSSSSGSKSIGAILKVRDNLNITGSISGNSVMNIGSWSKSSGTKQVNSTCYGTIKKKTGTTYSYSYSCNTCGTSYSSTGTCSKKTTTSSRCGSTRFYDRSYMNDGATMYSCAKCGDTYYYEPSSCSNQVTTTTTCGGSITRKSTPSTYTYYSCSICSRSGSSIELNSTCYKVTTSTQSYNYCSVCKKEI